jgi:UDP-N-acetylglucosamine 2-epimerase (non-hydrolysing)
MKAAPVVERLRARFRSCDVQLVHTGQHYDRSMSELLFEQLGMPEPDVNLGIGSGGHSEQLARLLVALDERLSASRPDMVIVFGDVNSTLAAALVASRMLIPVAHVEAGLRSFDRTMPEEVNRVLTDALSTLLFTTEQSANDNLAREGVDAAKIHFAGNVMIDTLLKHRDAAAAAATARRFGLDGSRYGVLTLHRPSNVDDPEHFERLFSAIVELARDFPIVFPVHPRTRARVEQSPAAGQASKLILTEPLGYLEFLGLMQEASVILTDSGGIQEEALILDVPCVTLRSNTERPVTLAGGANVLVGDDAQQLLIAARSALNRETRVVQVPPEKWDGHAAERIATAVAEWFEA